MDSPAAVLGAGNGGIDEMRDCMDDASVQWALLRFELGSGAFCRHKILFMHLNGEECPAVKRGQANEYTAEVQRILRANDKEGFHASIEVTKRADVTMDELLARVGKIFIADDLDYSVQLKQQDVKRDLRRGQRGAAPAGAELGGASRNVGLPGHQSQAPFEIGRDALRAVADPLGSWNWVLVRPDPQTLDLVAGGMGSVDEMREQLAAHEADVLFGLLRLGFGVGRLRRSKHVFVHAAGEKVSAVARGRAVASRTQMEQAVAALVLCSATIELARPDDLTLEAVIERVRRAALIDDDVLHADSTTRCTLSIEAFREALHEERASPPVDNEPEPLLPGPRTNWSDSAVEDVVRLVHATDGPLNWALFGPNPARMGRRARTMPALLVHADSPMKSFPGIKGPVAPTSGTVATLAGGFAAAGVRAAVPEPNAI